MGSRSAVGSSCSGWNGGADSVGDGLARRQMSVRRRLVAHHLENPERRSVREVAFEQRHRDVVNGHLRRGASLRAAMVGVPVQHSVNLIAIERLFQPARTQEWINL